MKVVIFGNIGFWQKAEYYLSRPRGVQIVALYISAHEQTHLN